jgi:hypothetical protein
MQPGNLKAQVVKLPFLKSPLYLPCADSPGIAFKNCDTKSLHHPFKSDAASLLFNIDVHRGTFWSEEIGNTATPTAGMSDSAGQSGLTWKYSGMGWSRFHSDQEFMRNIVLSPHIVNLYPQCQTVCLEQSKSSRDKCWMNEERWSLTTPYFLVLGNPY